MTNKKICPYFGKCGGCLYQDLSDDTYFEKKKAFIHRSFGDYGIEVPLSEIKVIPLGTRRRASFAYAHGHLGYNALKSHQIVEISECCLLKPAIPSFLPILRRWIQELGGKGDVFLLDTDWGLDIHIKTSNAVRPDLNKREQLALMASDASVVRLTYNNEPIAEKVRLPFLPDAFLQPSAEGEQILIELMLSAIDSAQKAIDLFCGSGTFTRPLLKRGIQTTGYDCSDSIAVLGEHGMKRDLFRSPLLPDEMQDIDLIVLDPPRAGAKAQVEQITRTTVPKIVMISCAPQTAARDCKILIDAGWTLKSVTPVDQFRWSNHIELVCILEKTK